MLIAGLPAVAQETKDNMMKITVTGTKSESTVKDYAGSVNVIEKSDYDKSPNVDIRNLLKDVPGVTTRKTTRTGVRGTPGISDVNIRGLDGDRILLLIDGIRLPDRYELGAYYNLGQGDYVDFSFLKSIEIIKGSISSLYGSDALGGLIYYRSLDPYDILQGDSDFNVEIPINYFSENDGRSFSNKIAVKLSEKLSALFIYTNEVSADTKVPVASKYKDETENYGDNLFFNLQYDFNDQSSLNVIVEDINRSSRIVSSKANLENMGGLYKEMISNTITERTRVSAKYSYESDDDSAFINKAQSTIFWQEGNVNDNFRRVVFESQDKIYNLTNKLIGINSDFKTDMTLFNDAHTLSYGFDVSENDGSRTRNTIDLGTGVNRFEKDTPDTKTVRARFYLQDQFSSGDFDFSAGFGYDYYSLDSKMDDDYNINNSETVEAADDSYQVITPKFTVSYRASDESTLYARYSQGFRPPVWYQLNASFENPIAGYVTLSNPDLKPEKSNDYEIGYKLNGDHFEATFATYYNRYTDFLDSFSDAGEATIVYKGVERTVSVFQTQNVTDAEIYGVEFAGVYFFNPKKEGFYLGNVFAWSEGNDLTSNIPLETIIPVTNNFSLGYKGADDRWQVSVGMLYSGRPRLRSDYADYIPSTSLVFDLNAYWRISDSVTLNASVNNLTDQAYFNFQDVRGKNNDNGDILRYSMPERNFQVGVKLSF